MPSTATQRIRAEKPGPGDADQADVWAPLLLGAFDRFDEGLNGVASVSLAGGSVTLTANNYVSDQARAAVLVLTGTLTADRTVTVPSVEKKYLVINNTAGAFAVTVRTASGTGYALRPGPQHVYCDGADVYRATPRLDQLPVPSAAVAMNGQRISGLGTPSQSTDAATKAYVDSVGSGGTAVGDEAANASTLAKRDGGARLDASGYYAGVGTAGLPAYTFSGDPNTGMRQAGPDVLALVTGGADRVGVTAAGDVGIGGALPVANAEVRYLLVKGPNTGLGYASLRLRSGLSSNEAFVQSAGASADLQMGTPGAVQLLQNGVFSLGFDTSGIMLIGQNGSTVPGYAGNVATGGAIWRTGRVFLSASSFSNWNLTQAGVLLGFTCASNAGVGSISVTNTGTAYNTSSDYRLKRDVVDLTNALVRLKLLKPRRFRFKSDPGAGPFDGFLAHEVSPAVPEAVLGAKDGVGEFGEVVSQQLDPGKLMPLMVASVLELLARVEALESGNA